MADFGYWALVPPLIAIGAAIVTRKVYLSLGLGILAGAIIFAVGQGSVGSFPLVFAEWTVTALATNIQVVVFTLVLGWLIALMQQSGGMKGFAVWAMQRADSPRKALGLAWFLGVFIVFIDDYFDTITVGTVMRPITDKQNVSREKLSYLVDTTAAPVAIIAPVSTWVGVIVGYIALQATYLTDTAFMTFLKSIPLNFYSFMAIFWALFIVVTMADYGPMKAAEARSYNTGALLRPGAKPLQAKDLDALGDDTDAPPRTANLVLPILTLVLVAVVSMWGTGYVALQADGVADPGIGAAIRNADSLQALVIASLVAVAFAALYYLYQRIVTVEQVFVAMEVGFKAMLPAVVVLGLAWTIGEAIGALGLGETMAELVTANIPLALVPPLVFLLGAFTAFATGTSFGTFAIMLPIAIPVAAGIDPALVPLMVAATVGGAVFGDHASPISDTTVLSSMASACDHVDHVRTQLPYAGAAALLAVLGYTLFGAMFAYGGEVLLSGAVAWGAMVVMMALFFATLLVLRRRGSRLVADIPEAGPGPEPDPVAVK
ncbi:MAG: Na+/H+ antiporter NhaC family protein [Euryarchaeota archaeon]|nr:Na+/H+ antiporter NhaC family protein [Euryarchaeota archaeon]